MVSSITLDDVNVTAPAPTGQFNAGVAPAPSAPLATGNSFPPTQDVLTILTGGQRLTGWLTSRVVRSVEMVPSELQITVTEKDPNQANVAIVVPGSTAQVYFNSDLVLTGWIYDYDPSYDGHSHNVRITVRSNTSDIVDSSFWASDGASWQIASGQSLKQAVAQLLKPFPSVGLTMNEADDVQLPFPYHINPGESVYSVIESLCRMCSRLLWDDPNGNLVISQVGTTRAGNALVEGSNIEAGAARINWVQRFNKLIVISAGQQPGGLNVPVLGTATDGQIRTERVKVIVMDMFPGPGGQFAQQRANWEMNRRIGRSLMVQVTTTGWRDANGALYLPNTIINVSSPTLKISSDLVIAECAWERDENGTRTIMTCMPAAALQPEPYIPQAGTGESL